MKRSVIIMAKAPRAGTVKTRLQPRLTAVESAQLAACLLRDTINKVHSTETQLIIAYAPAAGRKYFERLNVQNALLIEQKGDDLGAKMLSAFEFAARHADAAVMIGTDSPTFPADYVAQAFELMKESADAVLGRTADGGFYLIGVREPDARIFENVTWSAAQTFAQVRANIVNLNWHLREVPSWYDIDEPRDLERLREEFRHSENASRRAPETFSWISENITSPPRREKP